MPVNSTFKDKDQGTANLELVSIIVCTLNRADLLVGALASLKGQQTLGKFRFEIVVIDDGSIDSTQEVVEAQKNGSDLSIRYFRQEHGGVAAARNRGVVEAIGDWVAFFDDDQIAERNWLLELYEKAVEEGADCVGGPCLLRLPADCKSRLDPTIRRLLGEEPLMMDKRNSDDSGLDPRKKRAIPGTGNSLVNRSLFARVGLFSEARTYGEDREFFRRAERYGARFAVAPRAIIYHIVPHSRLTATYLLCTAALGGLTQAETDANKEVLINVILRFGHLLIVAVPRLGYAYLVRNQAVILARRCSIRFSIEYIACALRNRKGGKASIG